MKSLAGLLTVVMLLLTAASAAQEQAPQILQISEYNHFGSGARPLAMGNAFVGLADDVSSGAWNPAGIWIIENPVMSATFMHYAPNGEFTSTMTPVATQNRLNIQTMAGFSFVTPVRIKGHPWVFNFNYVRNNEYTTEMNLFSGFESEPEINPDTRVLEKGHMNSFRLGMTTRLYKQLSGGFTVNIYDARRYYEASQTVALVEMRYEIPPVPDSIRFNAREIDSTTSNGLNFTLGWLYKFEKLNVGMVVHTPFTLQHNTDIRYDSTVILNDLLVSNLSGTRLVDDTLNKQEIPLTLALGFAFFPSEKLTMTMDMNYQHYEPVKWYTLDSFNIDASGERTDTYTEYNLDWNNTLGIGAGVEYKLDTKWGRLPLRAGLRYDQWPRPKEWKNNVEFIYDDDNEIVGYTTTTTTEGRQSSVAFSLGTGVHWSKIELDLAWRYQTGLEWKITDLVEGEFNDDYIMDKKSHVFRATFVGYF